MANVNDEKKEVKSKKAAVGSAKKHDPNAPQANIFISKALLDARQEAIGRTRKYAGPVSDEKTPVTDAEVGPLAEVDESSDVPPTDCSEPE